jgi:RHS repeat-associated protein
MTYDPSKKITVSYNPLNLPRLVEFDNSDFIEYTYTATGTKLRKTVTSWKTTTGGKTDYAGQFLYQDNELSCIFTPVGRIVPMQYNDETFWKHEYNLKDHLGNTRIVFAAHPHGQPEVMQQTSYYPFGMTLQQQNFGGAHNQPNKLLYNGKELQDDELAGVSLDWYDYGARFYDPALGRWHVVDPMAHEFPWQSTYIAFDGNPINKIDPIGMSADWVRNEATDKYEWMDDVTSEKNTPEGYRYVGPNNKDILTDLNLPTVFSTKTDSRTSFGIDGDDKSGAPIGTKANVTGNIKVQADVSYDKDNISDNNVSGKTFKGVTFKASFNQSSNSPSSDLTMTYKGYFGVEYGEKVYSSFLNKPSGSYIYETGTNLLQAKISISSSNMVNRNVFKSAYISVGVTNPSLFISPKPIKLSWDLMRNQVFLPKH